MESKTCCLCGKTFEGWGNNPWPLKTTDEQCCDECNKKVVATRLEFYFSSHDGGPDDGQDNTL